ncbi:hypothetical protein B4099_1633 [Heyndrickxia coagulans]|uniref:Uncharacterized protein n=1 Tax=Heyndrickxia coagulans TaxID=1398 RepID=A0A150KIE4_HEYCO|nr:hypothetical protein B4099_1633 [Heyndrickxia coagulans]
MSIATFPDNRFSLLSFYDQKGTFCFFGRCFSLSSRFAGQGA